MYSNFAAGSTLSVQPGQRASCSTFKACRGAIGVLLRIGGVQLLAQASSAAERACLILHLTDGFRSRKIAAASCTTSSASQENGRAAIGRGNKLRNSIDLPNSGASGV